jgi:hypothetical protein
VAGTWRRRTGFARTLRHEIAIPPGPDGRPGERVLAPSASMHPPWPPGPDGSRADFRVKLSRRGSHFGAVCLGAVAELGDPAASAQRAIARFTDGGGTASPIAAEVIAGEPGCHYRLKLPRSVLLEWKLAHRGWLFAAGALCRRGDREAAIAARARAVLATWTWLDDD